MFQNDFGHAELRAEFRAAEKAAVARARELAAEPPSPARHRAMCELSNQWPNVNVWGLAAAAQESVSRP